MASSNRHWPNMFKSKTTHQDHQWPSRSSPYSSGCDERTAPEPKPRWNPKPEQIRILESIFNSGLVNPPRDEIRRIRGRLQEYGQVGDANVFYWFQNRKSRSKHKSRQLQKTQQQQQQQQQQQPRTSSSSSSDKSSSKSIEFFLNSPTVSVNQQPQSYLGGGEQLFQEPFFFPVVQQKPPSSTTFTQGLCFNEPRNDGDHQTGSGMLLTDLLMNHQYGKKDVEEDSIVKMLTSGTPPVAAPTLMVPPAPTTTIIDLQGLEEAAGRGKPMVFINDVPFEVAVGPFNVKEAFGGDAMLIDSSGQAVLTNEWGVTLQSLEHGAFYYLMRSFAYDHAADLI